MLADFRLVSRRVFRGLEWSGPSLQAMVSRSGGGFRGELWGSRPFASGEVTELAADVSWIGSVAAGAGVEVGAHGWAFDGTSPGIVNHSWELRLAGHWSLRDSLRASVTYHRDVRLRADTGELMVEQSVPLTKWGTFLEMKGWVGWSSARNWRPGSPAGPRRGGYGYAGVEARLPYRVGEHTTLQLGATWSTAWNARTEGLFQATDRRDNLVAFSGVSFDF